MNPDTNPTFAKVRTQLIPITDTMGLTTHRSEVYRTLCGPSEFRKPRLLIVGHGRHGKDTFAEFLRKYGDLRYTSSSRFVAGEIIWDVWGKAVYASPDAMFEDRVNHRLLWSQMISAYNTPDKARTARTMFERGNHMYVGMRKDEELLACKAEGLIDLAIWVDRSELLEQEDQKTFDIPPHRADLIVDNNHDLEDLERNAKGLLFLLRCAGFDVPDVRGGFHPYPAGIGVGA